MKAKELLSAAFVMHKGKKLQEIARSIVHGKIEPRCTYIQTFDKYTFCGINCNPDVEFVTTAGVTCYLYKVE